MSHQSHPFASAIADRDIDRLVQSLSPDVVVHSAVTASPFRGKDTVSDLYAAVLESFEEVRVVDEFRTDDTIAFFWEGRIDGRFVAGADRARLDAEGKVTEITIVGRPLAGLTTFLTGIGYRFALRRRGRLVATILRVSARPLGPLFSLLDPVSRWLAR
jgi:hypothetical protein